MAVPWVLMASYAYYIHGEGLLSDTLFDSLCKGLLEKWDNIQHRHKHLITLEDLRAGTLYGLREEHYPGITKSAAMRLLWKLKEQAETPKRTKRKRRAGE